MISFHEVDIINCIQGVRIRSYSGPYFPAFGLNNPEYGHVSRSNCNIFVSKTFTMVRFMTLI